MIAQVGLAGLALCAVCNYKRRIRLRASILIMAVQLAHMLLFKSSEPFAYFAGAAICDAVIILLLGLLADEPFIRDVQMVNYAAILVHMGGFMGYWLRISPVWYTFVVGWLSAAQILIMLIEDEENAVGDDHRSHLVRGPDTSGVSISAEGRR